MASGTLTRRDSSSGLSDAPAEIEQELKPAPAKTGRKRAAADKEDEDVIPSPNKRRKAVKPRESKQAATKKQEATVKGEEATPDETTTKITPPKAKRAKKEAVVKEEAQAADEQGETPDSKPRSKRAGKPKAKVEAADGHVEGEADEKDTTITAKPKRKPRKTAEEKAAEAMPLASRTINHLHFIGAHVSAAGGVHNAVDNAIHIGGNSFALFLKSQRKWANPALNPEHTSLFKAACSTHKYSANDHVLPHGSYLVNLAHGDAARQKQAYDSFLDDLKRCESLGIRLYNFHPGNTASTDRPTAIAILAKHMNAALTATSNVTLLLETMAASADSNTLGGAGFTDLRDVIALISPEHKSRVGVCLDTCHVFAAGHDLRSPSAFADTLKLFDDTVGLTYIKALHLNDSKAPLASHRDLHANIGTGFLGLRAFHNIVNHKPWQGLPLVLETPIESPDPEKPGKTVEKKEVWAREIKLLESLVGMDVEGDEFKKLEAELTEKGKESREKHMEQFQRKRDETAKKAERAAKKKGKKGKAVKEAVEDALEQSSDTGDNESDEEEEKLGE